MKLNYKKGLLVAFALMMNVVLIAQVPSPDEGPSGGGDPPAPISSYLIWLAVAGVAYAAFQYNANRKKA